MDIALCLKSLLGIPTEQQGDYFQNVILTIDVFQPTDEGDSGAGLTWRSTPSAPLQLLGMLIQGKTMVPFGPPPPMPQDYAKSVQMFVPAWTPMIAARLPRSNMPE